MKKTVLSPVFRLEVSIKNVNPEFGQVWMQIAGVPGWASTLNFNTEIVGSAIAVQQITDFLKGLSFVPAENDADFQEAADDFQTKLAAAIANKSPDCSIEGFVKMALENMSATTNYGNEHLTIVMTLRVASEVYYDNDNYVVEAESETLNIVTAPLSLMQIANALRPVLGCRSRALAAFESIPVDDNGVPQLPHTVETYTDPLDPIKITIRKP